MLLLLTAQFLFISKGPEVEVFLHAISHRVIWRSIHNPLITFEPKIAPLSLSNLEGNP